MDCAIKALDDWKIEIRAVPFGKDSDGQIFDEFTDYMETAFNNPAIIYHHGVEPGRRKLESKPVIIGKSQKVEKRGDGVYITALLDKTLEYAKRVWEAAKKGAAVASSDSIAHLARLDVGGRRIMYEKDRPGRIAVWPLAGVSVWDAVEGNFNPASPYAIAMPVMKAMYRDAGLKFPELDTNGAVEADEVKRRAKVKELQQKSKNLLKKLEK